MNKSQKDEVAEACALATTYWKRLDLLIENAENSIIGDINADRKSAIGKARHDIKSSMSVVINTPGLLK